MQHFHRFLFSFSFLSFLLIFSNIIYSQVHYYTNLLIEGSQEVPPTGSTGSGTLNATYDESTNQIIFSVNFSGLSTGTTAAHFHGPALPGVIAPPVITWTGFPTGVTSGSYSNTFTITDTQEADLLAGLWYANIHTTMFPGGEIRSQLFETNPIHSYTNLLIEGSQEVPPTGSPGSGTLNAIYDESTNQISFNVDFSGLSTNTIAAHFHGPALPGVIAPPVITWTGFPLGVTSGSYSNTFTLTDTQEEELLDGLWYGNIHTTMFPGGEIRGQLFENPTVDGNLSDPMYQTIATKQNTNSGFGPNINVNKIVYYADVNTSFLYIGIEGKLNTGSTDGIGFWFGFDELTGSSAGVSLGGSPGGHYTSGNGGANPNFKADFEVDYMFAVNPDGGATDVFFDAVKLVGARTAQYLGQTNQSGTAAPNINSNFISVGSVLFAFNNDGALNHGFEMCIPFSELGVTSAGELNVFVFVVSSTAFFSDVTVPGNVSGGNPGFDADFSTLAGGPYNSGSNPLPVELTSFTAAVNGKEVILNWSTATETNNRIFEIERKKENSDFITIGFVDGEGTTTEHQEYSYIDRNVQVGKYFYRLKQIDFDGTFEYSNEIEVDAIGLLSFYLEQNYPNPFNPNTIIKFGFDKNTKAQLKVYDVLGNEVANLFNETVEAGKLYEINFNASGLSSGVYYYQLSGDSKTEIKKMLLLK